MRPDRGRSGPVRHDHGTCCLAAAVVVAPHRRALFLFGAKHHSRESKKEREVARCSGSCYKNRKKNMPRSVRKFCDFYTLKSHANATAGHPQT